MIMSQMPTTGLYMYVCEDDNITLKGHPDEKLVIGTPLRYIKQTDESEYLFSDAAGNIWRMTQGQFKRSIRQIPNRLPNRAEYMLRRFYDLDLYAKDHQNPTHTEFSMIGGLGAYLPQLFLDWAIILFILVLGLPAPLMLLTIVPWLPNICIWLIKRKKVCGEFFCILKSPYKDKLLAELQILLHNSAAESGA